MNIEYKNRYGHMIHEYYVERLRKIMAERSERISRLKTRDDAERYVRKVRGAVKKSFGPMPKKTPLNPQTTGTDEYKQYWLEKIIYESRPGFFVTANLYVPKRLRSKAPAVLGLCGHSGDGKAEGVYQSYSQALANKGFVVLIVDPISQGERRQFYQKDGGPRPNLCHAHNLMGNAMSLADDFFGTWRVWDAIRGLDYLLSRPEVDKKRVGVTGNSGGGTLTTYVTALDPRITMAAPSCYICSYLANLENEEPADSEQNPPGIIGAGLDQVDLLLCYAPRPTIILSNHDDFFSTEAAERASKDLKRVHALLGAQKTAAFFSGPHNHGFHLENREAMAKFFLAHADMRGSARETGVEPVDPRKLFAAPGGEVRNLGSTPVFKIVSNAIPATKKLSTKELRETARKLLAIPTVGGAPRYRALKGAGGSEVETGMRFHFSIEPEPGIQVIASTYGPEAKMMHTPVGKTRLYVGNTDSYADVLEIPAIRKLAKSKTPLITVDPRGFGQSMAKSCNSRDFFDAYGSDYLYATMGEMLGENLLGRRVFDIMRTMDLLISKGGGPIELVGRGMGAPIVTFAALLHTSKPKVKIVNYLPSYRLITRSPIHRWPLSTFARGVLNHFDLPDVYKALGKRLTKSKPWNAMMK